MSNKQLYEKENNINKPFFPVVRLEDIIDTISEKSIQWVLNNYNHIYVEWKNDVVDTRCSVPTVLRRNGLWITYNNGDKLITEYYIGKNTEIKDKHWQDDVNWEDYTNKLIDGTVEYRHLSESLKQLFNKGNVTNFPDEEDLTSDGISLSFKNREYQPENFSGLGRVILRKNIVKMGEEYKNIITQLMISKSNTIYEIRYDFDLNNQTIIIPKNCIIKYEGGSINNGHIIYQNTKIQGIEYLNNVITEGLFVVIDTVTDEEDLHNNNGVLKFADREYNPNAFSGLGKIILRKNIVNDKNILTQDMINKENTVYEIRYDFDLNDKEITIPEGCLLDFQGGSFINGVLKGNILNEHIKPEWFGAKGDNITDDTESFINTFRLASNGIKVLLRNTIYSVGRLTFENCGNLYIEGENGATLKLNTDEANIIQIEDGKTVVIDNIVFDGNDFKMISNGGGLVQLNGGITKTVIKNCVFQNFKSTTSSNGFATSANRNFTIIENCKFIKCSTGPYLSDCTIVGCEFIECHWGCQFSTSSHFVVSNCKFSNNEYGDIYMKTDYETDIDKGIISNNFFTNTTDTSIFISTIFPKTTRDNNILISNNVFDLTDDCNVLTLGQINTDDSFYNCNGVIFQNNIVKNCGSLGVIYNANNVRLYNNIVRGDFLNIQGPIKDFIVDGLTIDFKGKEKINFIHLQGHYQTKEWLVDFTIRNFKVINAASFNSIIYQYYENNNDYISESSTINIENERDSFNAPITYYTNDELYNKVYFKYITNDLNRYGVKRAFGIGKIIIVDSLLYYWNGETFVKLDTPEKDNVFIVYYRNTNPYPMLVKPNKWKELQNSGEVALGVAVINGDKLLIVSLDEILLKWSSANIDADGIKATSINESIKDWNGKDNTYKQILHEECSDIEYAPGYCANYSKTNSNDNGIKAGKWWLPAMGELLMLFANRDKINYALSFIDGATLLNNYYWASTENNDIYGWYISFPDGYINSNPYAKKAQDERYVRPVTEFGL